MNVRKRFSVFLPVSVFLASIFLPAFPLTAQSTPAPVWVTITQESQTVAVVLPAGATYRFGNAADNLWSAPITVTEPTTFSPVYYPAGVFPFPDPDVGKVKELDVMEIATPQTVQVTNLAASPATSVAMVVPGLAPPTTVPMTPGTAYTLTFSGLNIPAGSGQSAPMAAFVNAPASLAWDSWQATQLTLTVDGVTMVCTLGPSYSAQAFTLNCAVPAAASGASGS